METRDMFAPEVPELVKIESKGLTLKEQFEAFHKANPRVYDALVKLAQNLKDAGWARAGIGMLFERLRWLHSLKTKGSVYKLNNNYRAFYARKIMDEHEHFDGFFEVRVQRSQN